MKQETCTEHDDVVVVYVGYECPMCELQTDLIKVREERDNFETQTDNAADEISGLNSQINDLEQQLEALKNVGQ